MLIFHCWEALKLISTGSVLTWGEQQQKGPSLLLGKCKKIKKLYILQKSPDTITDRF